MITPTTYKTIWSNKGDLSVVEKPNIPFAVKRIFWINNVPKGTWRAGHAHKECHQLLLAQAGRITVTTDGGTFFLEHQTGFHVSPMTWIDICFRSANASLLVLASHAYDESDYIRSYEEYVKLLSPIQQS